MVAQDLVLVETPAAIVVVSVVVEDHKLPAVAMACLRNDATILVH